MRKAGVRTAVLFAFVAFVVLRILHPTVHEWDETLSYRIRELVGRDSVPSSKLKLVAFDDATVAQEKKSSLSLGDWALLLETLAKAKPCSILIADTLEPWALPPSAAELGRFLETMKALEAPVVPGARAAALPPAWTTPFAASLLRPYPEAWLKKKPENPLGVFGIAPEIRTAFKAAGSLGLSRPTEGTRAVTAYERAEKGVLFPLGFFAASSVELTPEGVFIDKSAVHLDKNKEFVPNLISPAFAWGTSLRSVAQVLEAARDKRGVGDWLLADDVVLLMPRFLEESRHPEATARGPMPAGFVHASVANAVLTGQYLRHAFSDEILFDATGVAFLLGFALLLRALALPWATLLAVGVPLVVVTASWMHFASDGVVWEGLWFALGSLAVAVPLVGLAISFRRQRKERQMALVRELAPPTMSERILAKLRTSAKFEETFTGTVMTLDVDHFSRLVQGTDHLAEVEMVKEELGEILPLVRHHRGFLDRTHGDGLVVIFGCAAESEEASNHFREALECAIDVQRFVLERRRKSRPELPLYRIGIATGTLKLSALRGTQVDVTVIGEPVNLSRRMESHCSGGCIALGEPTWKALGEHCEIVGTRTWRRKGPGKGEGVVVFECNPFASEKPAALWREVMKLRNATPRRSLDRLELPAEAGVRLLVGGEEVAVVEEISRRSLAGVRFSSDTFLANGAAFFASLSAPAIPALDALLRGADVRLSIRWGRAVAGGGFLHGARLEGSVEKLARIAALLEEMFPANEVGAPSGESVAVVPEPRRGTGS